MKSRTLYRTTGLVGIALYALMLLEIPLYFTYEPTPAGTPPVAVILQRILIDLFICIGLIAFFCGFKHVVSESMKPAGALTTFIYTCGIVFATVAFVADSIQAGGAWMVGNLPPDPTAVGHGADGSLLIYGPINRLLNVCILLAGAAITFKTQLFPKWTAWLAITGALYNAAFIPTIFFMTTPLDFYSVNGWNIPFAAAIFFLWILVVSIFLMRKRV